MSESAVYLQPAFIIQHRPYREASVILQVFTRDFGMVSVLAKGVRKAKSKQAGILLPFTRLRLSYLDKGELKVLIQAEYEQAFSLQKMALYCGFYANELVQAVVQMHDASPELFGEYQACLQALQAGTAIEQALRYFELALLNEMGYGVQLDLDCLGRPVDGLQRYAFLPDIGLQAEPDGAVAGLTLLALAGKQRLGKTEQGEAKRLLRSMLDACLNGRPLKSREVLAKVMGYL